ncbi:MAG: WG repeat-containing protein [Salegentibacter sp.]
MMKLNQYEWDPKSDLIAEGAFAEVFKARDRNNLNRFVALKIYKEGIAKGTSGGSLDNKYTLEKEFRKVDGLSHTNIISYYGLDYIKYQDAMGRSASYPVIIMEYASEGTLLEFLKSGPDDQTRDKIIRDIIEGVAYLHKEGTIHRDLKPGNILITTNRRGEPVAKITDFGISRDTMEENLEQSLTEGVGTPHYMAPEQFYRKRFGLNGEISEQTDLWAIGIIVYRILTGKRPFGHQIKDYELIRDEIINSEPKLSLVPEKYKGVIQSCLKKKAIDRPKSAISLLAKIENPELSEDDRTVILSEEEDEATVMAPATNKGAEGSRKQQHKKKRLTIYAVLFVLVAASGTFLALNLQGDSEETSELAVVRIGQKFGYIDKEGNKVIPVKYAGAWAMSEGLGLVADSSRWGFINKSGDVVIAMKYDDALPFAEGMAPVKINKKWGFIDKDGAVKIPFIYDEARTFSNDLAPVKIDSNWGYINKAGETVIPTEFDAAYPFSEGYAVVRLNNKEGFINKTGKYVIPASYDYALSFSDNLAAVSIGGKWGFIDKTGNMVLQPAYERTWGFSEDLAPVVLDGKWGYIDKTGALIIPCKYEDASRFSNGLAGVRLNGKEGFIDKDEKVVIPFSYDYADVFGKVED